MPSHQDADLAELRQRIRHSAAHVMADVATKMFPDAKLAIGPPTEDGFYYDFLVPEPFSTDDLEKIEAQMAEKGIPTLDSPITGGVQRAWDKDITVISSGPQAVFDQVEPFLKSFAREIHYVGDKVGQAQLTKICNNIMSFTNLVVGLEALVMAAKGGVDPEMVLAVINSGSRGNF